MTFEVRPDPLLTCPLDESHRILKSRMQFHLVRCLRNNKLGTRLKCPWNPLHIVDKFAFENHYKNDCEDMPRTMEFLCPMEESRDVGSVPVTATNGLLPPGDEDWDAEPGPVGTYDPVKHAEGKPVLRIAIGLSKAKRKAYRQAERKRFQELEANGPIQTTGKKSEDPKRKKELRLPLTIPESLSANTSIREDLNLGKISQKTKNVRQNLTPTHKPVVSNGAISKNISSQDEACALDEIPNLCQSLSSNNPFNDSSMSIRSSIRSYDPIEVVRKARANNWKIPNLNDSRACFSEAEKSIYHDEPFRVPNLVGFGAKLDHDNDLELSHNFSKLATMKNDIDESAAQMFRQLKIYNSELPKLISSTSELKLLDATHDNGNSDDIPSTEKHRYSNNGFSKCAANFPKHTKNAWENQATVGLGRGMVMAYDKFKENKSAPTPEEITIKVNNIVLNPGRVSTNPFEMPKEAFAGNVSQQT